MTVGVTVLVGVKVGVTVIVGVVVGVVAELGAHMVPPHKGLLGSTLELLRALVAHLVVNLQRGDGKAPPQELVGSYIVCDTVHWVGGVA